MIGVCNYQYNPMKQHLESYKAKRQESSLPQINVEIFDLEPFGKPFGDEYVTAAKLPQELLTGK